jgi:hypothetical protein
LTAVSDHDAQLAWEARFARPAALCAFGSAALALAGFLAPSLTGATGDTLLEQLTAIADESTTYLLAAILEASGLVLLAPVLFYAQRAARARRDQLAGIALGLSIVGPLLAAAVALVLQVIIIDVAQDYLAAGSPTEAGAEEAASSAGSTLTQGLSLAAPLAFSFALVLVSVNAMRAGLFSRFLGILGIAIAALSIYPILGEPVILQAAWAAALGVLFLDRWPGGRGPAWERVEAVPWPTPAQRMEEQQRARAEAEGRIAPDRTPPAEAEERPRPPSRKRRLGRGTE